jgi:hypothetical protein
MQCAQVETWALKLALAPALLAELRVQAARQGVTPPVLVGRILEGWAQKEACDVANGE